MRDNMIEIREDMEEDNILLEDLSPANYVDKFSKLLDLEKRAEKAALMKLYMAQTILYSDCTLPKDIERKDRYQYVKVLVKNRLVNCDGCRALIKIIGSEKKFYGIVIHVASKYIYVEIGSKKYIPTKCDVSVSFIYDESDMSVLRASIVNAISRFGCDWLFPNDIRIKEAQVDISKLLWFDKSLNLVQKSAIKNILENRCKPFPYVIFGPPGTGKSVTLIELILQIYMLIHNSCVLFVAPSNKAVDRVAEVVCKLVGPDNALRLASQAAIEKNPQPFYTEFNSQIDFKKFAIILTTCKKSRELKLRCKFTHVIIDEAGQATEPETMIPLLSLSLKGQVILAGDPKQLGPYVESSQAKKHGLEVSFLERLLNTDLYRSYDEEFVTLLRFNYRSVEHIVDLASGLFYRAELIPTVDEGYGNAKNILSKVGNIVTEGGIYFKNVDGRCEKEFKGHSFCNTEESDVICALYKKLLKCGVSADSIGIITPYNAQIRVLTDDINNMNEKLPEIGSVEKYQGREKDIIIISAVRTDKLGFLVEPKRLNVMITRGKFLTFIFGKEEALISDDTMKSIVDYCKTY